MYRVILSWVGSRDAWAQILSRGPPSCPSCRKNQASMDAQYRRKHELSGSLFYMTHQKTVFPRPASPLPESVRVRGRDGRLVQIPPGFVASQGRDGRMVAVPSGAGSLEGRDGRLVVIPPGHIGIESAKGRVVPKPR